MRYDEPFDWVSFITAGLLIGCVVWLFVWFGAPIGIKSAPPEPVKTADGLRCSELVRHCRAHAETTFETSSADSLCDERKGRQKIEALLGDSTNSGNCPAILEEMNRNCPDGCRLAHDLNMLIPGKIRAKISERADESGQCQAQGNVVVTIRGTCTRQ